MTIYVYELNSVVQYEINERKAIETSLVIKRLKVTNFNITNLNYNNNVKKVIIFISSKCNECNKFI